MGGWKRGSDCVNLRLLLLLPLLTKLFPWFFSPLVFFGSFWPALAGLLLWAIGYATQDTLLKVLIASVLPEGKRSFAFGLFYLGYGGGWLLGSVVTGLLYEHSRAALVRSRSG